MTIDTPFERLKGREFDQPMAEIGETVHYMFQKAKLKKRGKMNSRWGEGVFLAVVPISHES